MLGKVSLSPRVSQRVSLRGLDRIFGKVSLGESESALERVRESSWKSVLKQVRDSH